MTRRNALLLVAAFLVSRIPFVFSGYGADPDAWRVAQSGNLLWTTGLYEPSRWPGYPLYELLAGFFTVAGSAVMSNSASVIASTLLLPVYYRLTQRVGIRPLLLTVTLAFTPLLWKSSVTTMDYVWSLLALLMSVDQALRSRPRASGFWAGVAAGFRPFNILLTIPILVLMAKKRARPAHMAAFVATSMLVLICAYSLPLISIGPMVLIAESIAQAKAVTHGPADTFALFGYRAVTAAGIPALAAGMVILVSRRRALATMIRSPDPEGAALFAGIISFLFLFLLFPLEREYLLPAVPFVLLVLDRIASTTQMRWLMVCIVSLAILNIDLAHHDASRGTPGLNVREGLIVEDWLRRQDILDLRSALGVAPLHGKTVVMTGYGPLAWFENEALGKETGSYWSTFQQKAFHRIADPDIIIVESLTRDDIQNVTTAGYAVYCLPPTRLYLEQLHGYTMEELGIRTLRY